MARHSLDAMAAGELHDPVEGGFFRYATRRDWSTPHFEKLLDDNARLALLYLDAFACTGRAAYAEVALGVVAYLTAVLAAPDAPVFFGSQDADEHYYACDAAGRRARAATAPSTAPCSSTRTRSSSAPCCAPPPCSTGPTCSRPHWRRSTTSGSAATAVTP